MGKYRLIAVWFLLIGIVELRAHRRTVPEYENESGRAQNDIKFGPEQQDGFPGASKSRIARLAPLDRPMKTPTCAQLEGARRQRERELAEQRVAIRQQAANINEQRFGQEWERQRVQRENMQQIATRLSVRANLEQERRNQERGAEELRRLRNNQSPYHHP